LDPLCARACSQRNLFRLAAFAASFPSAVRVFFGRCAIVRFRFASGRLFYYFFELLFSVSLSSS
jgi:hypothetical protein